MVRIFAWSWFRYFQGVHFVPVGLSDYQSSICFSAQQLIRNINTNPRPAPSISTLSWCVDGVCGFPWRSMVFMWASVFVPMKSKCIFLLAIVDTVFCWFSRQPRILRYPASRRRSTCCAAVPDPHRPGEPWRKSIKSITHWTFFFPSDRYNFNSRLWRIQCWWHRDPQFTQYPDRKYGVTV